MCYWSKIRVVLKFIFFFHTWKLLTRAIKYRLWTRNCLDCNRCIKANRKWECIHSIASSWIFTTMIHNDYSTKKFRIKLFYSIDSWLSGFFWTLAISKLFNSYKRWQKSHHYIAITSGRCSSNSVRCICTGAYLFQWKMVKN